MQTQAVWVGSWLDVRGSCLHVLSDPVSCPFPPHGQEGLVPAHFILACSSKVTHVVVAVAEDGGWDGGDRGVVSSWVKVCGWICQWVWLLHVSMGQWVNVLTELYSNAGWWAVNASMHKCRSELFAVYVIASPCQDELVKAKVFRVISNLKPKVREGLPRSSDQHGVLPVDVKPKSTEARVLFHPGFVQVDVSITL